MPADAPAITPQPPHYGIDLCKKSRIVPEEVSSWRVLVAWCVGVTVLMFVSSNLGRLTTVPPPLSILGTFVLLVVGWLAVSMGAQFVSRVRARGKDKALVQQGAIGLQEADVPDAGNEHARLRLIGKPEDIARVLRLVQPRLRFEPIIVRPSATACFPKAQKERDLVSTTSLEVPWWKRMVLILIAAGIVWGIKQAVQALGSVRTDFGLLELAVVVAIACLLTEWLVPTYLRIVPRRLDVMTFVPPLLGTGLAGNTSTRSYDLQTASIAIDISRGAARIEDRSRTDRPIVFVRAGSLIVRNLESEARVWGSLLSAALSHVEAPEMPVDRLVE